MIQPVEPCNHLRHVHAASHAVTSSQSLTADACRLHPSQPYNRGTPPRRPDIKTRSLPDRMLGSREVQSL